MKETVVYRVTGASDRTFRRLSEAVHLAAVWLDAFGSVWVTVVSNRDVWLHFVRDSRGILVVQTNLPHRGDLFLGGLARGIAEDEAAIVRGLENYSLT